MAEKIFVPDTDCLTDETVQEFAEKNNINTFADNERIEAEAIKRWTGGSMTEYKIRNRVLRFTGEWDKRKKIELAEKCFKLLAEAEPTVNQANSIVEYIEYHIKQTVLKLN